jgi:hypothetical protein
MVAPEIAQKMRTAMKLARDILDQKVGIIPGCRRMVEYETGDKSYDRVFGAFEAINLELKLEKIEEEVKEQGGGFFLTGSEEQVLIDRIRMYAFAACRSLIRAFEDELATR